MHSTQRILTIGVAAAVAAGCGGGGGGSEPSVSAPPAPPVANAAPTVSTERLVVVTSGAPATITATGTDADGDSLSYSWTQTSGTPVNSPQGASSASFNFTPAAGLPSPVETLSFQVSVSDGSASATSSIDVLVARDASLAAFVDGTNGDDTSGDGSLANPYASIEAAVDANSATDIYVMSLPNDASYDETNNILVLSGGRSLFGGFDADWRRDVVDNKSIVVTDYTGIRYQSIGQPAEISGFDVRATAPSAGDLNASNPYVAVRAFVADSGTAPLTVTHNRFVAEDATDANVSNGNRSGSSQAVKVSGLPRADITMNEIISSNGAPGRPGALDGRFISTATRSGGSGGAGGTGANENGNKGGNGGAASSSRGCGIGGSGGSGNDSDNGSAGATGCDGNDGADGIGGAGFGSYRSTSRDAGFLTAVSTSGTSGTNGGGGGGGGGGEAGSLGANGGRGGDGGTGGRGARGTLGGVAGGASIGVELVAIADARVIDNTISVGNGGRGGRQPDFNAGEAGKFGFGGNSGEGFADPGGNGGKGGNGGAGGDGGRGGSGAGGPAFAIYLGSGTTPTIRSNTLETGTGGERGHEGRVQVPTPAQYGRDGWSVGIFSWSNALDTSGISDNTFSIGATLRQGVSAEVANQDGEIILP